jgi:hypothetical protein
MSDSIDLNDIQVDVAQDFDVLPEDMYEVTISKIEPAERKKYQSEEKETVLKFEYTILKGEFKDRRLFQTIRPKLGAGEKTGKSSNLYKLWCAVEGRKFTKDDFPSFHLKALLFRNLKVVTENKEVGDKTYANISTFLKLNKEDDGVAEFVKPEEPVDEVAETAQNIFGGKVETTKRK